MKNIIVAQIRWPLQLFTQNLLVTLSSTYHVTFIIDEFSLLSSKVDIEAVKEKNIQVFVIKMPFVPKAVRNLPVYLRFFNFFLDRSVSLNKYLFSLGSVIINSLQLNDSCFIAIEKGALAFCQTSIRSQLLIYYSLELYYDNYSNKRVYKWIRKHEKMALRTLKAVIIQDKSRFDNFITQNNISKSTNIRPLYLPVTVDRRNPNTLSDNFWHTKFNLESHLKIILYFGLIKPNSRGLEFLLSNIPDGYIVIIHGFGSQTFIKSLQSKSHRNNLIISTENYKSSIIPTLINSADIGYCWYDPKDPNTELTAFSSEKIALFLMLGIPIISNNSKSYRQLYDYFECGIGFNPKRNKLKDIISRIDSSYPSYSRNAYLCYNKFYNYDNTYNNFLCQLRSIAN